jgi:hypothetical protein
MREFVQVQKIDLLDGEELMELAKKVMAAITQHKGRLNKSLALRGIFKDHIVVRDMESGKLFRMNMKRDDAGAVLLDSMDEVRQVFVPAKTKAEKAVWSGAFVNNLPDSSFLYIAPGGRKDGEGKTVPRGLRYFPVKDADGKVDLPHLRNALARIPQANIPQAAKDKATAEARKLLEQATEQRGKTEKAAGPQLAAVTLPETLVLLEDGKLSADSVVMLEEIAQAADPAVGQVVLALGEESLWRGVI